MSFDWKTSTAGPRAACRRVPATLAAVVTAALLIAACSHAPESLPPQSVAQQPAAAEGTPVPEPPPPAPPKSPDVITIEAAEPPADDTRSLVEAARRERQRRGQTGEPVAVITDGNLHEHATGQLTFVDREAGEATAAAEDGEPADGAEGETGERDEGERGEAYWRERVRELREGWRAAADRIPELEEKAAELRQQFYAADDAYYRDSRIKPAWDRAIDQIAQSHAAAEAFRLELEQALDDGRRAGALPGWLREGIELEPEPAEPPSDEHQPGEPQILETDDGDGRP